MNFYRRYGKRLFDIVGSFTLIILLSPVLILTAILIFCESGRPILFTQSRVGLKNRHFKLLKFRSMTVAERDVLRPVEELTGEITRVGRWLRRVKIDELPQLLNVLIGDMSLVGPRPTVLQSLDSSNRQCAHRSLVRPGMAGLAQVSGNVSLTWPERWMYDAHYVDSYSFAGDLSIIARTALVVIFGEKKFRKEPRQEYREGIDR